MRVGGTVFFLAAALAVAQSASLADRIREALAGTGHSDEAVQELGRKDFSGLNRSLAAVPVPGDASSQARLLSLKGAIAFVGNDMNSAIGSFEAAAKLQALSDADAFTEAMAFINVGDRWRARAILGRLAEHHPDRAIYTYWLGRLDYDEHRYEQAAAKLQSAIKLDPESARAWDSLGLTFDMQGNASEAQAAFEKAALLNRRQAHPSPWPPHDYGYWLLRADRVREAETALRESLHYDPDFAQAHYHLGRALEKEGRDSEAVQEYSIAVRDDASSSESCYSLALLYRKLHRDADASAMFAEYKKRKQVSP